MVLIERKASKGVNLMDADGVNKSADFSSYIIFFFFFFFFFRYWWLNFKTKRGIGFLEVNGTRTYFIFSRCNCVKRLNQEIWKSWFYTSASPLKLEPIEIEFPSVGYADIWLTDSETIRTCSDLYEINNVECEMWKGSTTYVNCILYFRLIFTWETLSPPP